MRLEQTSVEYILLQAVSLLHAGGFEGEEVGLLLVGVNEGFAVIGDLLGANDACGIL
jgi:hypothetical protein